MSYKSTKTFSRAFAISLFLPGALTVSAKSSINCLAIVAIVAIVAVTAIVAIVYGRHFLARTSTNRNEIKIDAGSGEPESQFPLSVGSLVGTSASRSQLIADVLPEDIAADNPTRQEVPDS